jgi:hypothetical protein
MKKPRKKNYNADRFYVVAYVRSDGELVRVYNTGTDSFHNIWRVARVESQVVLKTTTGRYLVTAHDDAVRDDNAYVTIGTYTTFNDKHSAVMAAIMRATKG